MYSQTVFGLLLASCMDAVTVVRSTRRLFDSDEVTIRQSTTKRSVGSSSWRRTGILSQLYRVVLGLDHRYNVKYSLDT